MRDACNANVTSLALGGARESALKSQRPTSNCLRQLELQGEELAQGAGSDSVGETKGAQAVELAGAVGGPTGERQGTRWLWSRTW
jgi:hypothetical protein